MLKLRPQMACRNCSSVDTKDLGFIGEVAPFFLKRVMNLELRRTTRLSFLLPEWLLAKLCAAKAYREMQVCRTCSFVQTKFPFSDGDISRLYYDYRSASYNAERISYEPSYAEPAKHTGIDQGEADARVRDLTRFLGDFISPGDGFTMLDYGGADGRYLPNISGKKYLYELSQITPQEGVTRVGELGTYSYLQMSHVLEHSPNPLGMLVSLLPHVDVGGYVYVEVPQDLSDEQLKQLPPVISVHEHINYYCVRSVKHLFQSASIRPIAIEGCIEDLGWTTARIIRALGQKNQ